jgi:acyl-CoA thioesterase II
MGNLADDTAVEGSDGHYRGELSSDWEIWGPNGGYVASVALRAAAAASRFVRPASLTCHYLSSAKFAPVDLDVVFLRQAKKAESLRVSMTQDGAPILEAMVWMIDDVDGLEHDHAVMPEVPAPAELRSIEELVDPEDPGPPFRFFDNLEQRPLSWFPRDEWMNRPPGEPRVQSWFKFRPAATFDEVVVDACRLVVLVDTMEWPAAVRAHTGALPFIAPSLDLAVRFHRFDPQSAWLLTDTSADVANDGLIGGTGEVYSESGRLLASGGQQMLCRPVPAHLLPPD